MIGRLRKRARRDNVLFRAAISSGREAIPAVTARIKTESRIAGSRAERILNFLKPIQRIHRQSRSLSLSFPLPSSLPL